MVRYIALAILALFLLLSAVWQPRDPDAVDMLVRHSGITVQHLLGTDHLGRDLLSRLMAGGWRTALVVLSVGVIAFTGGTLLGAGAAVLGGWQERAALRCCEFFITVPTLIIALTAAAIFGLTPITAGVALGLAGIGPTALLAHSLSRRVLEQPFIHAAQALGVRPLRMVLRHLLPNILPLMATHTGNQAGFAVTAYASLAFIGLGADPSKPDWGSMLFEYRVFIFDHPSLMIWPGIAIAVTVATLNTVFDAPD
ncbi:ABC transporter permease [Agrobacterium leguminum]|jgi:peptide/nickel transport system permease protein|uniref:ABC transporter permease n=1 Tax=Agrobacterium leguminum TaxID=2792015 RepID=UPI0021FD91E7|nr:ABC transporter permease [Agrobacterium tumefaciens]